MTERATNCIFNAQPWGLIHKAIRSRALFAIFLVAFADDVAKILFCWHLSCGVLKAILWKYKKVLSGLWYCIEDKTHIAVVEPREETKVLAQLSTFRRSSIIQCAFTKQTHRPQHVQLQCPLK